MNEIKPIKRSVQLQPLSREHHDGLLFVWKIRQGLNNRVSMDRLKKFTAWYWRNHIKPHFFQEEKLLLPWVSETDPAAIRMKKEHDCIRELILTIDREPEPQDLTRLANLVESHIRFEEREFFGQLEASFTEDQLQELAQKLEANPVNCEVEWSDEFWVKKKEADQLP
jgi:hemerythrin-like domain-containing protein